MRDDKQFWDNYKSDIIPANGCLYKRVRSDGYNYTFTISGDKNPGKMMRWGYTHEDNPRMAPMPEILDIEVSTICHQGCSWCYKSNTAIGKIMDPKVLGRILSATEENLTQVAFGIGDIESVGYENLSKYFEYCSMYAIVPNITINGKEMDDSFYDLLSIYCGTVDVSIYNEKAYDVIEKLTKKHKIQCNIHTILAQENVVSNLKIIADTKTNKKLSDIHAILFLMLKEKGTRNSLSTISYENFRRLLDFTIAEHIQVGLDTCSAPTFLAYLYEKYNDAVIQQVLPMIEPCEAGLFSLYINVDGEAFPCSFMEGQRGWETGIPIPNNREEFQTDVWFNPRLIEWRKRLLTSTSKCNCNLVNTCRRCPEFNLGIHDECKRS